MAEEIEVHESAALAPANLFGVESEMVIEKATALATPLAKVIEDRQLYTQIKGRKHVRVEGWTLLGAMLGVHASTTETKELRDPDGNIVGFKAKVEVHRGDRRVAGAEAICTRKEKTWKDRDDYAIMSMAQTRATSKALKQALSFVMDLAGFDSTPAEEMPAEEVKKDPPPQIVEMRELGAPDEEILETARALTKKRGGKRPIESIETLYVAPAAYLDELRDRVLGVEDGEVVEDDETKPGVIPGWDDDNDDARSHQDPKEDPVKEDA